MRLRGYEAIAVDLPGDDDSAGLQEYADTVVAAIDDRTDICLVAQSMAAFTAVLVCMRVPVALLVLVNAMIPAPGEMARDWWANTGQADARREMDLREGRDPDAGFDPFAVFFHDMPKEVLDEAEHHNRRQSDTPFGSPPPLQHWPDVPTRVLVGKDDRLFPVEFQRRVAQERLHIPPDEIPGGHLVGLSQPIAVADRLESYRSSLRSRQP